MEKFVINGGRKAEGSVCVSRAKNSLLPIIAAAAVVGQECFIEDFPVYSDTETMLGIIGTMGGKFRRADGGVYIDASGLNTGVFPADLSVKIRASAFMLGGVAARMGRAEAVYPGGCKIGERPLDIHLDGLAALGIKTEKRDGRLICTCDKAVGGNAVLPFPSVGATENIMIAAAIADGETRITGAATEPEIADLAGFLNRCGAKIEGAGTKEIRIRGVKRLNGCSYKPISDRIEAGTFCLSVLLLGGEAEICGCEEENISSLINKTNNSACKIYYFNGKIYIKARGIPKPADITVEPFPGFPTDLQPQTVAMLSVAKGDSVVTEKVFPQRFGYVKELAKLGADITVRGNAAYIRGVKGLVGGMVRAEDLRGGAGLVLAALRAEGRSVITGINHIDRGYEKMEKKFSSLGLDIKRVFQEV